MTSMKVANCANSPPYTSTHLIALSAAQIAALQTRRVALGQCGCNAARVEGSGAEEAELIRDGGGLFLEQLAHDEEGLIEGTTLLLAFVATLILADSLPLDILHEDGQKQLQVRLTAARG
jgi:hypothetical protein